MSSLIGTSLLSDDDGGSGVYASAAAAAGRRGPRILRSESPSSASAVSRPRSYVIAKSRAGSLLNNARAPGHRSPTRAQRDAVDRAPQLQQQQQQRLPHEQQQRLMRIGDASDGEDAMRRMREIPRLMNKQLASIHYFSSV